MVVPVSPAGSSQAGSQSRTKLNNNNLSHKSHRREGVLGGRRRKREGERGGGGGRRREKNDTGKPPSNPRGWPDRSDDADLEERPRRIIVVNSEQESWFCSNFVRTSKYTLLDFLPRFLMEEFHPRRKIANAYFLVLASLQTIPEITNTFGVPTILLPLSVIVIVDAIFAILEDVARHRADAKANASPTRVLDLHRSHHKFRRVEWSDVRVGDLLLVKNRESIPADLLVVGAHEPNPEAKAGICYVETKSLDGETNLKIRQAIRPTIGRVSCPQHAACLKGRVVMEHPNKLIDNFTGTFELDGARAGGGACKEAIHPRNLLLRGCVLRNTPWVVGLVLNTGPDTKIVMSSLEPPHKSSRLEQRTNVEVWRIVRLLCAVCFLGAVGSLVWTQTASEDHVYLVWNLGGAWHHVKEAMIQFFYLFLLLGNFIPVSLYVSMSTVKFCQSFFIKQDLDMYHEETDTPAMVRTMALSEDLGQVSHVFSDKTGTLTQNVMEFRKCSIGGVSYGRGVTDIGRSVAAGMGEEISKEDLDAERVIAEKPAVPHVRFYDPQLLEDLEGDAGEEQRALLSDFFMALAVCHTVIPERGMLTHHRRRRRRGRRRGEVRGASASASEDNEGEEAGGAAEALGWEQHREYPCSSGDKTDCGGEEESEEYAVRCEAGDEKENDLEADKEDYCEDEASEGEGGREKNGQDGEEVEEEEEEEEEGQPKLSASSPDDEALVLGARHFGMEFRDRVDNKACVRRSGPFLRGAQGANISASSALNPRSSPSHGLVQGSEGYWGAVEGGGGNGHVAPPTFVDERYEVLRILDFTSLRKRMSVIVRVPDGRVRILCKGADSVMIPRLAPPLSPGAKSPSRARGNVSPAAAAAAAGAEGGAGLSSNVSVEHEDDVVRGGGGDVGRGGDEDGGKKRGGLEDSWSTSSEDNLPEGEKSRERTLEHMERYAREGLRTLLVTCADVNGDWFLAWDKRFEAASTDVNELEKKKLGQDNAIDNLMEEVEVNLRLLGCTAIEDKLQDGVGDCVDALQGAGISVWMLTGDKEETAVNIAVACQLLGPENVVERVVINMDPQVGCQDMEDVRDRLEEELLRLSEDGPRSRKTGGLVRDRPRPRALIIDGQALVLATQPLCRRYLAEFAMECTAVVCCRVSPDQKRELVALVRETHPDARTLAIGDGANDVAMIQGAHIGIGISGQEGMQAVNASDFAIAQFRFLRKLMLFHGRQNYRRMSKLVAYTFYKNILMALPMSWYIVVNGYSGQKFYTEGAIQLYNILFTMGPILFLGCFDRDVSVEDTQRFPGLYVLGINDVFFNAKVFWGWMAQATAEAALITFVPLWLFTGSVHDLGTEQSLFMFGGTTFTLVVLLANSKILWLQYRWTWWAAALVMLAVLAWFGMACTFSSLLHIDFDFYMVFFHLLANPSYWAVVTLCLTAVVMRDLCWKFFHRWWQPKLHHIILEVEAKGGEPLEMSPAQWEAAAARAAGRNWCRRNRCRRNWCCRNWCGLNWCGRIWGRVGGIGGGGASRVTDVVGAGRRRRHCHRGRGDGGAESCKRSGDSGGTNSLTVDIGADGGRGTSGGGDGGSGSSSGSSSISGSSSRRSSSSDNNSSGRPATCAVLGEWGGAGSVDKSMVVDVESADVTEDSSRGRRRNALGRARSGRLKGPPSLTAAWSADAALGGSNRRPHRDYRDESGGRGLEDLENQRRRWGDDEADVVIVGRRLTDTMSSRPSSRGHEDGEWQSGTPATSHARSWSWTLPLEPYPPLVGTQAAQVHARSRSERINKRRRAGGGGAMLGSVGTRGRASRIPHLRPPSSGFAYSTDEASASLESEMILNYVESPLKKTPAFWDVPRPTLDRLVRRRESGLLPSGYGTGRWTTSASASPVGPRLRPHREMARGPRGNDNNNNIAVAGAAWGGIGGDDADGGVDLSWRAPAWLGGGSESGGNGASLAGGSGNVSVSGSSRSGGDRLGIRGARRWTDSAAVGDGGGVRREEGAVSDGDTDGHHRGGDGRGSGVGGVVGDVDDDGGSRGEQDRRSWTWS